MENLPHRVIPFGKYRGQPVEVLAADREYLAWLRDQPWFPQRFPEIHTLIVNNFGEPEFTPEHNRLQLEFLDKRISGAIDLMTRPYGCRSREFDCETVSEIRKTIVEIEPPGFDIRIMGLWGALLLECKPVIGEDFPAILRKMKTNRDRISGRLAIVFESFSFQSVSIEAVKEAFNSSHIYFVSMEEIRKSAEILKESGV